MRQLLLLSLLVALPISMDAASFLVQQCAANLYFDSTSLGCQSCGSSLSARVPSNTSQNVYSMPSACVCNAGYQSVAAGACDLTLSAGCTADTCNSCLSGGQAASSDRTKCLNCGPGTAGLDLAAGECSCPTGYALTETTATGVPLGYKDCVQCPNGTRVFMNALGGRKSDPYACQGCGDANSQISATGVCSCNSGYTQAGVTALAGNSIKCLLQASADAIASRYPVATASTVNFFSIQTSATGAATGISRGLVSAYLQHYFLAAAVGCRGYKPGQDAAPCQSLANLCVLQMYDTTSSVCQIYQSMQTARSGGVNQFSGWPSTLPLLYWGTSLTALLTDTTLTKKMEYKKGTTLDAAMQLRFYLAKFSLNGTFLGIERLRNQFAYCAGVGDAMSPDPSWTYFGYGSTTSYTCDIRMIAHAGEPIFYDLYLRDLAADGVAADSAEVDAPGSLADLPLTLYPVPVRIVNYRGATGNQPNINAAWSDESDDVLFQRFVLYDTVSGVRTPGSLPEVTRYATKISLSVRSQAAEADLMAPPVLTIEYHERQTVSVMAGVSNGMAKDTLKIRVDYSSDYAKYSNTIVALGASLAVIVGLWASLKVTAWMRMSARSQLEANLGGTHVLRWALYVIVTFAFAFFWYLVVVCAYWLAYFKLQDSVYSMLPVYLPTYKDDVYNTFKAGIWVVWIAYCVRIAWHIYKQVTVDIFFVDWEKSRGGLFRMGQDVEDGIAKRMAAAASQLNYAPVSAWRTIFAANEWAELSTMRRTDVAMTMITLVVLLEGAKLKYVATPQPMVTDLSAGEINPALQFANTVFWYFVIVAFQILYQLCLGERYIGENPTTRYVDLCTVMKTSVLLMDEKYHGYYIHANAPHEHSDGTMKEIADHLFEEAAATRVGRGLPGCPDPFCQTFELHVPALWREQYDRVFRRLLDQESAAVDAQMSGAYGVQQFMLQQQQQQGSNAVAGGTTGQAAPGGVPQLLPGQLAANPGLGIVARARERTRRLAAAQQHLTAFMKGFIEETDPDYKRVWRDKTLLQAAFDVPPDMLTEGAVASAGMAVGGGGSAGGSGTGMGASGSRLTYTYTDHMYRFERLIFRGIELDLLIFEVLLFCLVDFLVGSNPAIAAVSTYVISWAVSDIRKHLGNRNVTYKTLVDSRFLI